MEAHSRIPNIRNLKTFINPLWNQNICAIIHLISGAGMMLSISRAYYLLFNALGENKLNETALCPKQPSVLYKCCVFEFKGWFYPQHRDFLRERCFNSIPNLKYIRSFWFFITKRITGRSPVALRLTQPLRDQRSRLQ